jgi:hypothetical protein
MRSYGLYLLASLLKPANTFSGLALMDIYLPLFELFYSRKPG